MFESLSEKLSGILDKLTGRGALSEEDVNAAMREVRRALLEADVALEVVRSFVDRTRTKAVGAAVIKSVRPGQMVVKIVHDSLVETLGGESQAIDLNAPAPVAIMLVGLQGAGKTTTAAKIAKRLSERDKRKVLMASLDVKRPAAQEQLAVLGEQVGVATLPIVFGEDPVAIAKRAESAARLEGYDVVLLDTAGRTHIDEPLMAEMADIRDAARPHEILLVADAGGVIVGALIAASDGWRGNMYRLAVRVEHRRAGIGLALVRAGEQHLVRQGANRVTALVANEDEAAVSFWEAAGYPKDHEIGRHVRNQ